MSRRARLVLTLVVGAALFPTLAGAAAWTASPSPRPSPSPSARSQRKGPPVKPSPTVAPSPNPSASPKDGKPRAYTNEDLEKSGTGQGTVNELPDPAAPPPPAREGSGQPPSAENAWRQRARTARAAVGEAEVALEAAESRVNALTADLDPNWNILDPNRLQTLQAERAKAIAALEAAQGRLAAARKAVEELEEEARRAGVNRRWLEENNP